MPQHLPTPTVRPWSSLRAIALSCLTIVFAAATAPAQIRHVCHTPQIADGFDVGHAGADWIPVDANDARWAPFADRLGPGWRYTPDAAFGGPRWLVGPGRDLVDARELPLAQDRAVELLRDLVEDLATPLGIDDARALVLSRAVVTKTANGHDLLGVDFDQTYRGFRVQTVRERRRIKLRVDLTLGRLSVLGSDWIAGLDVPVDSAMPDEAAIEHARTLIPASAPGTLTLNAHETYVLAGKRGTQTIARLVHHVEFRGVDRPHLWRVIFDARSGERLFLVDAVCHVDVTGNVALGSMDGASGTPPTAPFSVKPAPHLFVSVVGGNRATTDVGGNFRISHGGSAQVQVRGGLDGQYCNVNNQAGADLSFSQAATPGTPVNIVLNGSHATEFQTAEANGYHWVNAVHAFVRKRVPSFSALTRLPTNVNMFFPFGCNAYFDGQSINFTRTTGGCNNMAFAEIIAHEWGHAFHQWFAGSINNAAFSEGIGDHLALYLTDQRMLGRGIQFARDYRRPGGSSCCTRWPTSQYPSPHQGGEVWAGTMMDMRDNLVTRHGATTGKDISERIAIPAYTRNPSGMPSGLMEVMLQDDNDANLANGTPNFAEIAKAADRHALPRPADPTVASLAAQTKTPRRGSTLNFELHAVNRMNASFGAAFSFALGSPTIPGVGTLGIRLPIFPLTTGVTDTYGEAKFNVFIPQAGVLQGLKLHTQAIVLGSPNMISTVWTIDIQ